jgi:hypothetical protein
MIDDADDAGKLLKLLEAYRKANPLKRERAGSVLQGNLHIRSPTKKTDMSPTKKTDINDRYVSSVDGTSGRSRSPTGRLPSTSQGRTRLSR